MKKFFPLLLLCLFNVCILRVSAVSVDDYKKTSGWMQFNNIEAVDDISWQIVDGTLIISGTGAMENHVDESCQPWAAQRDEIISVVIDNGVTTIGDYAFTHCANLMSVSISASVEIIGGYAFMNSGVQSVSMSGNALYLICGHAFSNCDNLTSIAIPASVELIGQYAFNACISLTSIEVDSNNAVFSSEDGVLFFKNNTLVAFPAGKQGNYTVPATVETITTGAFERSKLTSVILPESVETIGDWAFGRSDIQSVTILGNTLKSIGYSAFHSCASLTSINIPASIETIGTWTFLNCGNLAELIMLGASPVTIQSNVFAGVDLDVCILRVPAASIKDYRQADVWREFRNIVALEAEIIEISLDRAEVYLLTGATSEIMATVTGVDAVEWNSGNTAVATVINGSTVTGGDSGTTVITAAIGVVTAISPGTTVITASAESTEASCTVTVIEPGKSTIEGNVSNTGGGNARVNLYMK